MYGEETLIQFTWLTKFPRLTVTDSYCTTDIDILVLGHKFQLQKAKPENDEAYHLFLLGHQFS